MARAMIGDTTIVAVATPAGQAGIGVVRISGPRAVEVGRELFRCRPPLGNRPRYVEYGSILGPNGQKVDSGLAWVFRGPRSYTGEDTVEISGHGSDLVLGALVEAAMACGAVMAQPGEFTRRAFVNGRMDLLQAEAVVDLIQAGSDQALRTSYGQASGRLSEFVGTLKHHLIQALSLLEVGLDFVGEEDGVLNTSRVAKELAAAMDLIGSLLQTFSSCRRRLQGVSVVLIGRPNVGKSTLLNALLQEDRAIVTSTPGTTRDLVEGSVVWSGELIRLTDTAGIREKGGPIEQEGIQRARAAAESADLLLVVTDKSDPWRDQDANLFEMVGERPCIHVANKTDLPRRQQIPHEVANHVSTHSVSAAHGTGMTELRDAILGSLPPVRTIEGVGLTRLRHAELLSNVHRSCAEAAHLLEGQNLPECASADIHSALRNTGELLGENVDEAVLDQIFSEFCIGK